MTRSTLVLLTLLVCAAPAWTQHDGKPLIISDRLSEKDKFSKSKKTYSKVHEVELKKGQLYIIELRSVDFDAYLRLEDAEFEPLAANNDISTDDFNSRLLFSPKQTGTYRLIVTSAEQWQTGDYRLLVETLQKVGKPQIIEGELTKKAQQEQGKYYALHRVEWQKGQWWLLDLKSSDFDPYLRVRDEQGQTLVEDDDSGGGLNARLLFEVPSNGEYLLQALSYQVGQRGMSTLRLQACQRHESAGWTERELWARQARTLNQRGVEQHAAGAYAAALKSWRTALMLREKLYPKERYPQGHPHLASSLNNLGAVLAAQGEFGSARDYYQQALQMSQQLYPKYSFPHGHPHLASSWNNLGFVLYHQGEYRKAHDYFQQALKMNQQLYPQDRYPRGHPNLADCLHNLGGVLAAQGETGPAHDYYQQALKMQQQLYPQDRYPQGHSDLALSLNNLGSLFETQREHGRAHDYYQQACKMFQQLYPKARYPQGHPHLATSLNNLGAVLQEQGESGKARDYCQQALKMFQQLYPKSRYPQGHLDLAGSLNGWSRSLRAKLRGFLVGLG